jgi:Thioredoxin/Trypsin-like peptidase domain
MSIAPLLLAFLSVAGAPSNDSSSGAVLLNFHAQWCTPCHKARPAVEELIRNGYPIKRIDIDEEPDLPRRYRVEAVPTFVVVDRDGRELGRLSGPRSASELARFYRLSAAKAQPPADSSLPVASRGDRRSGDEDRDDDRDADDDRRPMRRVAAREVEDEERPDPTFSNPKPWESVVRIQVIGERTKGFGSGTVIYSTPQESLVLTCAHIFKLDGRKQAHPSRFPRRIVIDLFDGKLEGTDPARVHYVESVEGKAVDYDFTLDVGLIRMRPGRQLPASRVVPATWDLQSKMKVVAVGCPEGRDATVWHTRVRRPRILNFLSGNPYYEAIECDVAPKEGRSGGGLYTLDGYVVGVCNFAEPQGNHGLYATPRSIYRILDKNDLASLYAPIRGDSGTMLADRRSPGQPLRNGPGSVVRSQTPEPDEPVQRRAARDDGDLLVPAPSLMGIADPVTTRAQRKPVAASGTTRRASWQATRVKSAKAEKSERGEPSESDRDELAAGERPYAGGETPAREREFSEEDAPTQSNRTDPPKTRWREVKLSPRDQAPARAEN